VFLTNPTIDELLTLDMSLLMDMLVYQTRLYVQLMKQDGVSSTTKACRELIDNLQSAIYRKKALQKQER